VPRRVNGRGFGRGISSAVGLNGALNINAVAPNDWRSTPPTGEFDFPFDVFRFTPSDGRIRVGGHPSEIGAAKAWPIRSSLSGANLIANKAQHNRERDLFPHALLSREWMMEKIKRRRRGGILPWQNRWANSLIMPYWFTNSNRSRPKAWKKDNKLAIQVPHSPRYNSVPFASPTIFFPIFPGSS
jgi:hypothetical protein